MPSDLLKCIICPKKPKFSDVSHLLTHVGSKGHLAHLHSLQVRSHQELSAGHQLAIYNQWFQEHGVAALLSQRMKLKDQKKANKKVTSQHMKSAGSNIGVAQPNQPLSRLQSSPVFSAYESHLPALKEDFDDEDHAPVKSRRYPAPESSPPNLPSQSLPPDQEDEQIQDYAELEHLNGIPLLKGKQWPGMDLFDAASEEQRRKRNQRKDGSVLRRLERSAAMVEPTETVHSAVGEVLKRRHMDDLENDSPVEGEEAMRPPTPKRRKLPTARAPRARGRAKGTTTRPGRPRKQVETPTKVRAPSPAPSSSSFSPPETENRDFKLAVKPIRRQTRKASFTIFEDSPTSFGNDGFSEGLLGCYSDIGDLSRSQLSFPPPIWHRPQAEVYDPFKLIRERFTSYVPTGDDGQGKENTASTNNYVSPAGNMNPLSFQVRADRYAPGPSFTSASQFDPNIVSEFNAVNNISESDVFMPVRNPLMNTFEQFKSPTKEEDFEFNPLDAMAFTPHYRQPLFAP